MNNITNDNYNLMPERIFLEYNVLEKVYRSNYSEGYRVQKRNDDNIYFLKLIKPQNQTLSNIAHFKKEYNILKSININGIIKIYDIFEIDNNYVIIQEDFSGLPLSNFIEIQKRDINLFLSIAIQLTDTLGQLHNNNIIHNNLKPTNILYNKKSNIVKITDFGINKILTKNHFYTNSDKHTYSFYKYSLALHIPH